MSKKIVCVVGPTACGKTTLGVLIAEKFHGEVVSADSMQIYKGMSIGSAAPTEEEQHGIPHHMIAVANPQDSWSAARYAKAAVPIIDDILRRDKLPILVGGSGLWLDAVIQGHDFPPGHTGGTIRQSLKKRLTEEGIEPILKELQQVDPETAARLHPSDTKRILRALEIYLETGKTMTAYNQEKKPLRYDAVWIGLRFRDRADMRYFIDQRTENMIKNGLLDEARTLSSLPPTSTALQAIGYKELFPVLRGTVSIQQATEEIKLHTRQYAKRQLTWFRRNPSIHWIEWERERDFTSALQISTKILMMSGVC